MFKVIILMLICNSANAAMYSCIDKSGTKTLRSHPCLNNEKQQVIENVPTPSYSWINSTGEQQQYRSRAQVTGVSAVSAKPQKRAERPEALIGGGRSFEGKHKLSEVEAEQKPTNAYMLPNITPLPSDYKSPYYDGQISIHDMSGNYSYGRVSESGQITIHDMSGNYSYGRVSESGQISIYDMNGNYSYGRVSESGQISIYDMNGNYSYGNAK